MTWPYFGLPKDDFTYGILAPLILGIFGPLAVFIASPISDIIAEEQRLTSINANKNPVKILSIFCS